MTAIVSDADLLNAVQEALKDTTDEGLIQLSKNVEHLLSLVKAFAPGKAEAASKMAALLEACIEAEKARRQGVAGRVTQEG